MTDSISVALAQLNLTVGDIAGNLARVERAAAEARDRLGCAVVVFPELTLSGYPPEDLLLRADFIERNARALQSLADRVRGIDVVVGYPARVGRGVGNCAAWLRDGRIVGHYQKHHLPNYGVFDEKRYFQSASEPCVVELSGIRVGVTICEDIWDDGPVAGAVQAGAALVLNLNASPFHVDKGRERTDVVARQARTNGVPILYVNLVGGQDELVFDGASFAVDSGGRVARQFPAFEEGLYRVDVRVGDRVEPVAGELPAPPPLEELVYRALVLGVRDYIGKNGFPGAVIGLSGGIDSALTLAIAVDAIGPDRVEAVTMPSRYTAPMSVQDATEQARALGVTLRNISIEPMFESFLAGLREEFAGLAPDTTEENIQARCRGVILMAISNKTGKLVLTTGNKSEMSVGYATLYGDMAGGFAVIKDVPKTLVYRLAAWRNARGAVIPQRVIDRPPSAELAPDQKDTDSLPSYDVLDPVLQMYVEQDRGFEEIVASGHDPEIVRRVLRMVDRNEYKRRQAAPGIRITRRAFGRDRRYPITSGFRSGD